MPQFVNSSAKAVRKSTENESGEQRSFTVRTLEKEGVARYFLVFVTATQQELICSERRASAEKGEEGKLGDLTGH